MGMTPEEQERLLSILRHPANGHGAAVLFREAEARADAAETKLAAIKRERDDLEEQRANNEAERDEAVGKLSVALEALVMRHGGTQPDLIEALAAARSRLAAAEAREKVLREALDDARAALDRDRAASAALASGRKA